MFDGNWRTAVDRSLTPIGHSLRRTGVTPDVITIVGIVMATVAAATNGAGYQRFVKVWRQASIDRPLPARRPRRQPRQRSRRRNESAWAQRMLRCSILCSACFVHSASMTLSPNSRPVRLTSRLVKTNCGHKPPMVCVMLSIPVAWTTWLMKVEAHFMVPRSMSM